MTKPVDLVAVKAVVEALHAGETLRGACKGVGVSPGELLMRVERKAQFKAWMAEAGQTMVALVEDALYENARNGNATAQTLYLCNRAPDRWRPAASARANADSAGGMTPADFLLKYRREDRDHETASAQTDAERGDGQGGAEPDVA